MPDLQAAQNSKEKIISVIRSSGPSFPARISRTAGLSPLFTAAFLSELVSERRLKLSRMKVGSSPLYYITGQEERLQEFVEHLNHKEREAFELLKASQILEDKKQHPAIRVALRKINDFAIPINAKIKGETNLFWKFYTLPDTDLRKRIESLISGKKPPKEKPRQQTKARTSTEEKINQEIKPEKPKIKKPQTSEFANQIKDYLSAKDIEILESISEKKKEFISKIRTDELFGKQEYYLISKDKKKVTTNDLTIALQQAQTSKMPALFLSPGELDKKAKEHLKEWRNLIKFEQIKF